MVRKETIKVMEREERGKNEVIETGRKNYGKERDETW